MQSECQYSRNKEFGCGYPLNGKKKLADKLILQWRSESYLMKENNMINDSEQWPEFLEQSLYTLANISYNMGFKNQGVFLETAASVLKDIIAKDLNGEPATIFIDHLKERLIFTGDTIQDTDTLWTLVLKKPWLKIRNYQVSSELQAQMLRAHHANYLWYETLGLMLEQREAWASGDVLWLIVMASEYIDEKASKVAEVLAAAAESENADAVSSDNQLVEAVTPVQNSECEDQGTSTEFCL